MKYLKYFLIFVVFVAGALILYCIKKDPLRPQFSGKELPANDFVVAIEQEVEAKIEEIDRPTVFETVPTVFEQVKKTYEKMEIPERDTQIISDTMGTFFDIWKEFHDNYKKPDTKHGKIKSMELSGTEKVLMPKEVVTVSTRKSGNVDYSFFMATKDGCFREAIKIVYLNRETKKINKSESYQINFSSDLLFPSIFKRIDLGVWIRFHPNGMPNFIRKKQVDKKYSFQWDDSGKLLKR